MSAPLATLTDDSITQGLRWLVNECINLGVTNIDTDRYKFDFWTATPVYADTHRRFSVAWAQYEPLTVTGNRPTTGEWISDLESVVHAVKADIEDGIIRDYWAGTPYAKIALDLGWDRQQVKDVLVRVGGEVADARVNDETLEKMAAMVDDGAPHEEIARTLKVDKKTIRDYFGPSDWATGSGGFVRYGNQKMEGLT